MSILGTIIPNWLGIKVPESIRAKRLITCISCPSKKYVKLTGQCKECFCFVREKVELVNEKCPEGHWNKYKP